MLPSIETPRTNGLPSKTQRIESIVKALEIQGEHLRDDDLQQIQLKTDPLLEVTDEVHVDQGDTHVHIK
jgi:hypothetical protein